MPNAMVSQRDSPPGDSSPLTSEDRVILAQVENALRDGLALLRWWRQTDAADAYVQRFPLIRNFNIPDESFAFFDQALIRGQPLRVMGTVEDMLYDQPKMAAPEKVRDQLREFVLHYFMRVSAFERPEAYAEAGHEVEPRFLPWLSWCPRYEASQAGFGFAQLYYKRRDTGEVGKFAPCERFRIVDVRDIGTRYEWIVVKIRIYDFNLTFSPRGQDALQFVLPLKQESYLVLSRDFVANEEEPTPEVLGRYGIGYAFIRNPIRTGPFAYGPGEFTVSFQLIHFRVLTNGRIQLSLVFVANRPEQILSVSFNPLSWGLLMAELTSLGLASRFLAPLRVAVDQLAGPQRGVDPVRGFVSLVNAISGGSAARDYCISMEHLERRLLVQHFMQHYQMVVGSLLTWRQHADWLDQASLPPGIVEGMST
jgi:hypothetical protein